jgi:tetratricopeptide (TPR) repeat protein
MPRVVHLLLIAITTCLFFSPPTWALDPSADVETPGPGQSIPEPSGPAIAVLLKEADANYARRGEPGRVQAATELYNEVLTRDPGNYEALWRCAACYYWLADELPKDQEKPRELIFSEGLHRAERAVEAEPDSVEGNFWYGVLLGQVSLSRGIFERLAAVDPIIRSMEKVLAADPKQAFAYHVLGIVYRQAPGWPFSCGNLDRSLMYAYLAVENRPDSVLTHLGLGEALLAMGRTNDAEIELNYALLLPGPPEFQPETLKEKQAVVELLLKIVGEKR